jgi:hypothetical protein
MSGIHVARWSCQRPAAIVIADPAGRVVGTYSVERNGDCPGPQMLWDTPWCAYPGSEWEEEPPGEWSVAVFNEGLIGGGGR